MTEKDEGRLCPCCERYYFEEKDAFEICPVCGWEDDKLQRREADFAGGANKLSLNEAREAFLRKIQNDMEVVSAQEQFFEEMEAYDNEDE